VCSSLGFATNGASADYIGLYEGDADLLMASLSLIQKTATDILVAIADPIEQESRDADSKEPIDLPLAA
jgi:hypothetical protein